MKPISTLLEYLDPTVPRKERDLLVPAIGELRGKWIALGKLIAPALVDRLARRAIERGL